MGSRATRARAAGTARGLIKLVDEVVVALSTLAGTPWNTPALEWSGGLGGLSAHDRER